jgi:hypothetical protein
MIRKLILTAAFGLLAIPAVALAKQPAHPGHPATTTTTTSPTHPAVQFVLRGALSAYAAANGATNGSIAFTVKSSNFERSTLKGTTLTFAVSAKTKLVQHDGAALATGDSIVVKVRALKGSNAATLESHTPSQVIDQG